MTLSPSLAKSPAKPKREARPKAGPDAGTLRRLTARIEELATDQFGTLLAELEGEGLKLKDKGLFTQAALAGVTATTTAGLRQAISNWAMAARRKIIELEG